MPITHVFVNGKAEPGDATLIRPSNWNADHLYPSFNVYGWQSGDDPTFPMNDPNPPAGVAEVFNADIRTRVDLTRCTQARVISGAFINASLVAVKFAAQYSLDQVTWAYLDGANGPFINMTPVGLKASAWVNLVAGAKADVWLRWITREGTGAFISLLNSWLQVR
jgi:hypothetical protein